MLSPVPKYTKACCGTDKDSWNTGDLEGVWVGGDAEMEKRKRQESMFVSVKEI